MLDPLFDAIRSLFAWIASIPGRFFSFVKVPPRTRPDGTPVRGRWRTWLGHVLVTLFAAGFLVYFLPFVWAASGMTGWDVAYPREVIKQTQMVSANETTRPGGGAEEARSCGRSQIVDMMAYLVDWNVNQNTWIPSMPQSKFGFFGIPWEWTPFLDNKASFQHGELVALRRMAVELTDQIGRVRGTSEADPDLAAARGLLQADDELWWFNPFSERLPFGPVQPAPDVFRGSIGAFHRYNARLLDCQALFDTRSDNLRQMMDRIATDVGSVVDSLDKRSNAERYDPRTHAFIASTGNNRGWFDFLADNRLNHASGMMYAYHGLLQAVRVDFAGVIQQRSLGDVWDRMEAHLAEAAAFDPLIVSNGREDGFAFPAHLASMSSRMLQARANMSEIVDILDR